MFIGSIDDGIYIFSGDVALYNLNRLVCGEEMFCQDRIHELILPRYRKDKGDQLVALAYLFRLRNHSGKCLWVANCQIRKHLAVQIDVRLLERCHQFTVGGAI